MSTNNENNEKTKLFSSGNNLLEMLTPTSVSSTDSTVNDTFKWHLLQRQGIKIQIQKPNIRYDQGLDPFEDISDQLETQKRKMMEAIKKKMQFDDIIKEVKQWKVKK